MANNETSFIITAVDKTAAVLNTVGNNLNQVGSEVGRLQGAVAGFAAAAGVGMFASMIKGGIEAAAGLQQLSEQTGATVEGLSAMKSVARLSGTDLGEVGGALQKLSKNMVGLDDDSKEASKAIAAIGLSATALKNMRPDEAMKSIADAMANYSDGAEKTAIAMALFGKAGANALPFLKDLAEAGQLNAKVSAEQVKMADDFEKNLTKLSIAGDAWKTELTAGMLPALSSFSEAALATINGVGSLRDEFKNLSADGTINEWATATINGITNVADAVEGVARVFEIAGKTIGAYYASLASLASGDFSGVSAIRDALAEDIDAIMSKPLLGQRLREAFEKTAEAKKQALVDYGKSVTDVLAAYAGYDIKIQQAAMKSLSQSYFGNEEKPRAKYASGSADDAGKSRDELKAVLDKINGKDLGLDASYWKDLDTLNKGYKTGKLALDDYAEAVGKLTKQQKFAKDITEKEAEAVKAAGVAWAKQSEDFYELMKAKGEADRFAIDTVANLELEAATLGMTSEARERYIAIKQLDLQKTQGLIDTEDEYLDRLNKINAAYDKRDRVKSVVDEAKKIDEEWKKTTENIERSLTDALLRGFESGKSFAQNMRDTIVNMFKTMVLRPVIQGVVQGGMSALGIGGAGNAIAGATGQAGGGFNLLSSGNSMLSSGLSNLGGAASGFMSGMSEAALGSSFVGPSAELAGGAMGFGAQAGNFVGSYGGYIGAAIQLMQGNIKGAAFTAAGAAIGSIIPGVGTLIGGMVGSVVGSFFGKSGERFPRTISSAVGSYSDGKYTSGGIDPTFKGKEQFGTDADRAMDSVVNAFTTRVGSLLDAFNLDDSINGQASIRLRRTSGKLATGFMADMGGGMETMFSGQFGGDAENIEASIAEFVNSVMTVGVKKAIEVSTLPDLVKEIFTPLNDSAEIDGALSAVANAQTALVAAGSSLTTFLGESAAAHLQGSENLLGLIGRTVGSLLTINPVLEKIGQSALAITLAGGDAASALVTMAGGMEAFAAKSQAYYESFFSAEERQANFLADLTAGFERLDVAMPANKDAFRALVESLDLTTGAGQKTFTGLMNLSGAFTVVANAAEAQAHDYRNQADSLAKSLAGILGSVDLSVQDLLESLMGKLAGIKDARAGLQGSILEAQRSAMTPEQRLSSLKTEESSLFSQLATSDDPAGVAQRLQSVILSRIQEEVGLSEKLRTTQGDAIREQITGYQTLQDMAGRIAQFTGSMRFGNLSSLNNKDQLGAAESLYSKTLAGAKSGDADALGNLTGNAQAYLTEAKDYYASSVDYAKIFESTLGSLDALGVSNVDPQIAALQNQLTAIESVDTSVRDGAVMQVEAFTRIDSALEKREAAAQKRVDEQLAIAKDQIVQLIKLAEKLDAQIVQQSAIATQTKEQLATANAALAKIADSARTAEAAV